MRAAYRRSSLQARLVTSLGVLLVACAVTVAVALDAYYRDLDLRARREVLEAQVLALIATAEVDPTGSLVPGNLADPRLATPGSGLYALIRDGDGRALWRSPSLVGATLALGGPPASGERALQDLRAADGTRLLALTLSVRWETGPAKGITFAITAAQSLEPHFREVRRVRVWILAGSAAVIVMLLAGLVVTLRLALRPLRDLERQIEDIENGRRERLDDGYPRELAGVAGNLNALLITERERLERYRKTLGNLAHSLKTPLAALKALLEAPGPPDRVSLAQQTDRMHDIVDHQLRRAVLSGAGATLASLPVAKALGELQAALLKVYHDRRVGWAVDVDPELTYPMDRGDFMELAGSLLDNACKYGRGQVAVRARARHEPQWRRPGLELVVEDDGPGIAAGERARVLGRGERGDQRRPGQGIGLAVVQEIAAAHGGSVEIGASGQGGARVTVLLPGR